MAAEGASVIHSDQLRAVWRDDIERGLGLIPVLYLAEVRAYALHGARPDPWLRDLIEVADLPQGAAHLRAIANFFRTVMPPESWGSKRARLNWELQGGIEGMSF